MKCACGERQRTQHRQLQRKRCAETNNVIAVEMVLICRILWWWFRVERKKTRPDYASNVNVISKLREQREREEEKTEIELHQFQCSSHSLMWIIKTIFTVNSTKMSEWFFARHTNTNYVQCINVHTAQRARAFHSLKRPQSFPLHLMPELLLLLLLFFFRLVRLHFGEIKCEWLIEMEIYDQKVILTEQ